MTNYRSFLSAISAAKTMGSQVSFRGRSVAGVRFQVPHGHLLLYGKARARKTVKAEDIEIAARKVLGR